MEGAVSYRYGEQGEVRISLAGLSGSSMVALDSFMPLLQPVREPMSRVVEQVSMWAWG